MVLSFFCENVMHSQGNLCFFTKIKCIESSSVHCIMDFCKESNNVVKAILLYKISVKTSENLFILCCLIENTLDYNDLNKKQKRWKCVFILSGALQK